MAGGVASTAIRPASASPRRAITSSSVNPVVHDWVRMDAVRIAAIVVTLALQAHGSAVRPAGAEATRPGLDAYAGIGAWIDRYDFNRIVDPQAVVDEVAANGAHTIYVETASWRVPRNLDFVDEGATAELLDAAHAAGIKVVAWYLPGLADRRTDLRRVRAAIDFTTFANQKFDSFALDIEANIVNPVWRRNLALLQLSRAIRAYAGDDYALGAIVPDRRSTCCGGLWPGLPYKELARTYDVFLPMAYSSFGRASSARGVYAYTRDNVTYLRRVTGRPVHVIGGLTGNMSSAAQRAVARAARDAGAYGMSLYKYMDYSAASWDSMASFGP